MDKALEDSTGACQREVYRRYGHYATPEEVRVVKGFLKDESRRLGGEEGSTSAPKKNQPEENNNAFSLEEPIKNFRINLGRILNSAKMNGHPVSGGVRGVPAAPKPFVPY